MRLKSLVRVIFWTFVFISCHSSYAEQEWENVTHNLKDLDLHTIAVSPDDPDIVFVGSSSGIFRTQDSGDSWQKVYSTSTSYGNVNFIAIHPERPEIIFAATRDGLLRSTDSGIGWEKVFSGIGDDERWATSVGFYKDKILLGTRGGLFFSTDNGKNWKNLKGRFSNSDITYLFCDTEKDIILVSAKEGLFRSIDGGNKWDRVFETSRDILSDIPEEVQTQYEVGEFQEGAETIKAITQDPNNRDRIFIGNTFGVFYSKDSGLTWKRLTNSGLLDRNINFLLFSPNQSPRLYAATDSGIFSTDKDSSHWIEVYKGLNKKEIRAISSDKENSSLWLASKGGVFRLNLDNTQLASQGPDFNTHKIFNQFSTEPTIKELQEIAVRYAEVHPQKIESWRKAAAKKAILPDLSVGLDRYVTDLLHWDSGTNPDTFLKGDDVIAWDVSLTWELGDLIWNNDQTSIDTRSRLMVQLRDDILDEITRTYFERRRLQIELLFSPPTDLKTRLEKELRLQELTADIDALTGGYFTKILEERDLTQ